MKKILFLLGFLLPFACIIGVNLLIIQTSIFSERDFGLNRKRITDAYTQERIMANAAFFGTSRTLIFTPNFFEDMGIKPAWNMSLGDGTILEIRSYFENAQNAHPLKTVLMELDYLYFTNEKRPTFLEERLLTSETRDNPVSYIAYKMRFLKDLYSVFFSTKDIELKLKLKKDAFIPTEVVKNFKSNKATALVKKPSDQPKPIDQLKKIIAIAKEKKTDIIFYTPPLSAPYEEVAYGKRWEEFEKWKRSVVALIDKEKQDTDIKLELWDFSGYNTITNEPFPPKKEANKWYKDTKHFKENVAAMIFNRIHHTCYNSCGIPSDFGIMLTPKNIEAKIKRDRAGREAYLKQVSAKAL